MEKEYKLARYKEAFQSDGSLRDIYVFDTDKNDWNLVLQYIKSIPEFLNIFYLDKSPVSLDLDCEAIFRKTSEQSVFLDIDHNGLRLDCHFFTVEEIELSFNPGRIDSDRRLTRLIEFIRSLGHLLGKRVVITPENEEDVHYFSFDPRTGNEVWSLPEWHSYKLANFQEGVTYIEGLCEKGNAE